MLKESLEVAKLALLIPEVLKDPVSTIERLFTESGEHSEVINRVKDKLTKKLNCDSIELSTYKDGIVIQLIDCEDSLYMTGERVGGLVHALLLKLHSNALICSLISKEPDFRDSLEHTINTMRLRVNETTNEAELIIPHKASVYTFKMIANDRDTEIYVPIANEKALLKIKEKIENGK